jgi:hypothetical protein
MRDETGFGYLFVSKDQVLIVIMRKMDKAVRKFSSHEEAAAADRNYYQSLTGQERIGILLEIIASQRGTDEASQRLVPVYRIRKLREDK